MPGEPQLAYGNKQKPSRSERTEKKRRRRRGEEEERERLHREVFRRSWRKKMGKVFICGMPR